MLLTAGQFKEMIASLRSPSSKGDRRKSARLQVQASTLIAPLTAKGHDDQFTVLAKDISLEGVGLLSSVALKAGQQILIHLAKEKGETAYVVCTVMHCSEIADSVYSHGVKFDRIIKGEASNSNTPSRSKETFEAVLA